MDKKKVILNRGEYVFCFIEDIDKISMNNITCSFKESEGYSIIISKKANLNIGAGYHLALKNTGSEFDGKKIFFTPFINLTIKR